MLRRSVAKLILIVSLAVGTLAWAGFVSLNTVLDPNRSEEVADALYDDDAVRDRIADNLAAAASRAIPAEAGVSDEQIQSAARTALAAPVVRTVVVDSLVAVHQGFLGRGEIPEQIDAGAIGVAARAALVEARPELDSVLPAAPELTVDLPVERIPNASPLRTALGTAVPVMAVLALGGIALALIATNDRPAVLKAAGRRALAVSAVYLVIALGLPRLAEAFAPNQAEIVAALVGALMASTLTPALVLAGSGVAAVVVGGLWRRVPESPARPASPSVSRPPTQRTVPPPRRRSPPRLDRPPSRPRPRQPPPERPRQQPQAGPQPPLQPLVTRPPTWVDGVGWVLDPGEPTVPASARWVPGYGYVVETPEG